MATATLRLTARNSIIILCLTTLIFVIIAVIIDDNSSLTILEPPISIRSDHIDLQLGPNKFNKNATIMHYNRHCLNETDLHPMGVVAGLYNTGTNALYNSLQTNCNYSGHRFLWQPQWGKHEMYTSQIMHKWELRNSNSSNAKRPMDYKDSLLMVLIKDPLTWIKSMCKANYDFVFMNYPNWIKQCPLNIAQSRLNWMPKNRGREMNKAHISNGIFESIVHVWNAYYEHYLNRMDENVYHYLMVRFEDFLFDPTAINTLLCTCFGNRQLTQEEIVVLDSPSKTHGKTKNRSMFIQKYSNPQYRYEGYSRQDMEYIYENVNHTILNMFGYTIDLNNIFK